MKPEEFKLVDVDVYANPHAIEGAKRRVILLAPHGAGADPYFQFRPEILAACENEQDLRNFTETGRDTGSFEVTDSTKEKFISTRSDICEVVVIKVNLPREVKDGNRTIGTGSRENIIDQEEHSDLWEVIDADHDQVVTETRAAIQQYLREGDILIDIHTMCNYNIPKDKQFQVEPHNLGEQHKLWNKVFPAEFLRVFCIITETMLANGERKKIMTPEAIKSLKKVLDEHKIPYEEDKPYYLTTDRLSTEWGFLAEERKAFYFCFDIAKWMLTNLEADCGSFDHAKVPLEAGLIEEFAGVLFKAVTQLINNHSRTDVVAEDETGLLS